jgi:hypothetical protein
MPDRKPESPEAYRERQRRKRQARREAGFRQVAIWVHESERGELLAWTRENLTPWRG